MLALHLEVGLAVARDPVEEERLLDRRHERVADAAEQRVVRPDRQLVLAALGEASRVVAKHLARRIRARCPRLSAAAGFTRQRPDSTSSAETSVYGARVIALVVDEPDGVEDLHRLMRVEARHDLRDRAEVAVDELAEPAVVVDRAGARATADEELEARDAEGVLDVDGEQADAERVVCGRPIAVLLRPRPAPRGPAPRTERARPRRPAPAGRSRAPAARASRASLDRAYRSEPRRCR